MGADAGHQGCEGGTGGGVSEESEGGAVGPGQARWVRRGSSFLSRFLSLSLALSLRPVCVFVCRSKRRERGSDKSMPVWAHTRLPSGARKCIYTHTSYHSLPHNARSPRVHTHRLSGPRRQQACVDAHTHTPSIPPNSAIQPHVHTHTRSHSYSSFLPLTHTHTHPQFSRSRAYSRGTPASSLWTYPTTSGRGRANGSRGL